MQFLLFLNKRMVILVFHSIGIFPWVNRIWYVSKYVSSDIKSLFLYFNNSFLISPPPAAFLFFKLDISTFTFTGFLFCLLLYPLLIDCYIFHFLAQTLKIFVPLAFFNFICSHSTLISPYATLSVFESLSHPFLSTIHI